MCSTIMDSRGKNSSDDVTKSVILVYTPPLDHFSEQLEGHRSGAERAEFNLQSRFACFFSIKVQKKEKFSFFLKFSELYFTIL